MARELSSGLGLLLPCVWTLIVAGGGRADFEEQLLQKFRGQNQNAGVKLKEEISANLAHAGTCRTARPEHALELVRKSLDRLEQDSLLGREERAALIHECQERVRDLREVVAEQERQSLRSRAEISTAVDTGASVKASPAISYKEDAELRRRRGVAQAFAGNAQITPVVSADRRFVRIGMVGGFIGRSGNAPLIPIQVPVPSVFPGPGPGVFTVGQPVGIAQFFLPQLTLTGTGLGTGGLLPAGGGGVLAGYSSVVESRYESGTPVLGKIPYLGRLFRNVGYGRSSQATEIVISPRIVIVD